MPVPARAGGATDQTTELTERLLAPAHRGVRAGGVTAEEAAAISSQRREAFQRRSLILADIVALVGTLILTMNVLGEDTVRPIAFILGIPALVLLAKASGLYDRDDLLVRPSTIDEIPQLFQLATLFALIATLTQGTIFQGLLGNGQLLCLWVSLLGGLAACRLVARRIVQRYAPGARVLVIGDHVVLERLQEKLHHDTTVQLVGSLPFERVGNDIAVARGEIIACRAQRVIIAPPSAGSHEEAMLLVRAVKAMGVRVSVYPGVLEVIGSAVEFDHLPGVTLLGVKRSGLTRSSRALKRAFDLVGATIGLVLVGPLMAIFALRIKLDTPGPVLFRQTRVGRDGREFEILKFRTMVDGADSMREALAAQNLAEGVFKIPDDPRITKSGAFLRRTSLDELPQLFNVLRGQMSIVGPRPLVLTEDARIRGLDRRRLELTPGMTGPWQVAGSARMSLAEMVKMDYLYVAGWSLWNDVKIVARTVRFVLDRSGH